nr:hypothetical protein [uncultured Sphingomonas sp.]
MFENVLTAAEPGDILTESILAATPILSGAGAGHAAIAAVVQRNAFKGDRKFILAEPAHQQKPVGQIEAIGIGRCEGYARKILHQRQGAAAGKHVRPVALGEGIVACLDRAPGAVGERGALAGHGDFRVRLRFRIGRRRDRGCLRPGRRGDAADRADRQRGLAAMDEDFGE